MAVDPGYAVVFLLILWYALAGGVAVEAGKKVEEEKEVARRVVSEAPEERKIWYGVLYNSGWNCVDDAWIERLRSTGHRVVVVNTFVDRSACLEYMVRYTETIERQAGSLQEYWERHMGGV